MKIVERAFYGVSRPKIFNLYPIGDIHIGAAACDEERLKRLVNRVKEDKDAIWLGMGDYCDFINRGDRRYDPQTTADWLRDEHDMAKEQIAYLTEILSPIAHKCIGLIEGNHEREIKIKWERDVQYEIVQKIKDHGKINPDWYMDLGYYSWINFKTYFTKPGEKKGRATRLVLNVHHGFTGGRLAGAKALNLQRWLWIHDADLVLFGHSHSGVAQPEIVQSINAAGKFIEKVRKGTHTGTFLKNENVDGASTYSERKGYFPVPLGGCMVQLRPQSENQYDRVKIIV